MRLFSMGCRTTRRTSRGYHRGEWTCTPLHHFRQRIPSCFTRAERQVQCQVLDALLTEDQGTHPIGLTPPEQREVAWAINSMVRRDEP